MEPVKDRSFLWTCIGWAVACQNSRPSSLPPWVAFRETPLGAKAKNDGCFRRLRVAGGIGGHSGKNQPQKKSGRGLGGWYLKYGITWSIAKVSHRKLKRVWGRIANYSARTPESIKNSLFTISVKFKINRKACGFIYMPACLQTQIIQRAMNSGSRTRYFIQYWRLIKSFKYKALNNISVAIATWR